MTCRWSKADSRTPGFTRVRRPRQPQGSLLTPRWRKPDSNLYGAFPVKWSILVFAGSFPAFGGCPHFEMCPVVSGQPATRISLRSRRSAPLSRWPRLSPEELGPGARETNWHAARQSRGRAQARGHHASDLERSERIPLGSNIIDYRLRVPPPKAIASQNPPTLGGSASRWDEAGQPRVFRCGTHRVDRGCRWASKKDPFSAVGAGLSR